MGWGSASIIQVQGNQLEMEALYLVGCKVNYYELLEPELNVTVQCYQIISIMQCKRKKFLIGLLDNQVNWWFHYITISTEAFVV